MTEKKRIVKAITDPRTGKRKYFYGKSKKEVNQKILAYRFETSPEGRTFAKLADEWWTDAHAKLEYQTIKVYKPAIARSVAEFGSFPISSIKPKDIQRFLDKMALQMYAQKTISNQRLICNLIFKYAVLQGDIEHNPCAYATTPKCVQRPKRSTASNDDEEIIKRTWNVWLLPFFALTTGMRKGEILALQWKDIDFDTDSIYVYKSVYHEGDRAHIKTPKTESSTRIVPLLDNLKSALLTIKSRPCDNYLFSDDGKTPLTNRRYITLMNRYREATGITCTAHQLRHSFATIAFENGVDAKAVQEVIGHKQISTTLNIYTNFRRASVDKFRERMNNASN